MEYNFDIELTKKQLFKDINKLIFEIKRCKSKTMYIVLANQLESLYYICDTLSIYDYPDIDLYSMKNYMPNNNRLIRHINKYMINHYDYYLVFSNNVNGININQYEENESLYVVNENISLKDNLTLLFDFFNKYNNEMYELLKKIINKNKLIINNSGNIKNIASANNGIEIQAFTIKSDKIDLPYIYVTDEEFIYLSIFLAHEIGHCYEGEITRYNYKKPEIVNHFGEVFSHFIGFVYMDYLTKNKICLEDVSNVKNGLGFELTTELKSLNYQLSNLKMRPYDELISNLEYSFGITLALHFFDKYLIDPEQTNYEIRKFMELSNYYSSIELLEKLDLKDEIIDSKVLKKYLITI